MPRQKTTTRNDELQPPEVQKPRPDYPLTPHRASGQWCKKINRRVRYFGKLDDPEAAEAKYLREVDDLKAGRVPRPAHITEGRATVADCCNSFLESKRLKVASGELTQRTWDELFKTSKILTAAFGRDRLASDLRGSDFEALRAKLATRFGPVALTNQIQRARSVFKFAATEGIINQPVQFGASFVRPSKRIMRLAKEARGPKMFSAEECRLLLDSATPPMRAFILLGLNAAFTGRDIGTLPRKAVDLKSGVIAYARPKTGVARRCLLWRETIEAMQAVMQTNGELAFLTEAGTEYTKGRPGNDPLGLSFRRLMKKVGIERPGVAFAALRHVFQTVAEGSRDFPAIRFIMGHVDDTISAIYRETIDDERLRVVSNTVREWLFPSKRKPR